MYTFARFACSSYSLSLTSDTILFTFKVAPTTKRPTSSIGTNDPTSGKKIGTTDTSRPSTAPAKPTNTDDSTPGHVSRETKTAGHASTTSRPFERPVPRPQKKNSSKIWIAIGSSFAVAFLIFGLLGKHFTLRSIRHLEKGSLKLQSKGT